MKAIVITYDGRRPLESELRTVGTIIEPFSNTEVKVQVYTESSISKLLVENSIEPKVNVEDGNSAVVYIAGMVDKMNIPDLSVAVIKHLTKEGKDETTEAFRRAVSIIANGAAVDIEVAKKYGFTTDARDVITKLYNAWKGYE